MFLSNLLIAFVGYSAGRIGHIFGGNIVFMPHHWIIGIILVFISLFLPKKNKIKMPFFYFGLGLFISDFKDFTYLRFWDPENVKLIKFWGFD